MINCNPWINQRFNSWKILWNNGTLMRVDKSEQYWITM